MDDFQKLIYEYEQFAITHGEGTKRGDYKATNTAYKGLKKIYGKTEKDPALAEQILKEILSDNNIVVELWGVAHALGVNTYVDQAQKTLVKVAQKDNNGIIGFNAEMTLKEWKEKGGLKF